VFLYFDELEVCNPLGSKSKTHKLGKVIIIISKLHTCYREFLLYFGKYSSKISIQFKLKSIQLLAIVKTKLLSLYGMDVILEPIVRDLKKLVDL